MPESLNQRIASRLRMERARLDLTLKEAGERSGVSYVSICRYERGELPRLDALNKLATAYGVPLAAFLSAEEGRS